MEITLEELNDFFNKTDLPKTIRLNESATITNVRSFVDAHLETATAREGNKSYAGFKDRLILLKTILENPELEPPARENFDFKI